MGESMATASQCLPSSRLQPPSLPSPLLLSSELIGVGFVEFGSVWMLYVTGRGHGVIRQGGMRVLMGAKVTGADPPSLTARMPSPRPLRLRSNSIV